MIAIVFVLGGSSLAGGSEPRDTYETTIAADSPVAQYRFEDSTESTTLADAAGSDTGTNHGVTLGGAGPFGGSASGLFGGEAYDSLASDPLEGASEFTAEAWVYWSGESSYDQPIFDLGSSATNHLYLTPAASAGSHDLTLQLHTTEGASAQVTAPELSEGAWHYVAVSESGTGELKLYVDGAEVGDSTEAAVEPAGLGSAATAYLGKSLASAPEFEGRMSNVAFYAKALSATAIKAHYDAGEFPVNTTVPTLSGTAEEEQELTAHAETWTGLAPITFGYQWLRCDGVGEGCAGISGATGSIYDPSLDDVGHKLRVRLDATNPAGSGEAVSPASVVVVAPLSLTELGYTSEFGSEGVGDGQFKEPWGVAIGAEGDIFVADRGNDRIEKFNEAGEFLGQFAEEGSGDGQLRSPVALAADGKGHVWVADGGNERIEEFDERGEFIRSAGEGLVGDAEGIAIDHSGHIWVSATYDGNLVVFGEDGEHLKDVGTHGSEPGQLVQPEGVTVDASGRVWVADDANQRVEVYNEAGEYLSQFGSEGAAAGRLSGPNGIVVDAGHVFLSEFGFSRIQEFDEEGGFIAQLGVPGSGTGQLGFPAGMAIDDAHALLIADGENDRIQRLSPEAPGAPATLVAPSIWGNPGVGDTYEATAGVWSGSPRRSYAFQWQRCDEHGEGCEEIAGATGSSYTVIEGDVGSTVRVLVTATNSLGSASSSSASSEVIVTPPVNTTLPTIPGTPHEGGELTANPGEWERANGYGYEWQRCNVLGEECVDVERFWEETYTPTEEDVGHTLRVVVSASNAAGEASATSAPTAVVAGPSPPVNLSDPTITGAARNGETLTASHGAWEGAAPISYGYQWQHCNVSGAECGDIEGATEPEYEVGSGDIGTTLRVTVTASNAPGSSSASSAPTAVVAPLLLPTNVTLPTIVGASEQDATLTAGRGVWEGARPISYAYQWQSCNASGSECSDIEGATATTYELGSGDIGATLRVEVTASNAAGSASVTSPATGVATARTLANLTVPEVSGVAQDGETVTVVPGTWRSASAPSYGFQWQACNVLGEACADISGATDADYAVAREDVGSRLRVLVTANVGEEEVSSASEPTPAAVPAYAEAGHFGSEGSAYGQFSHPGALALTSEGHLWVLDTGNSRVEQLDTSGEYISGFGSEGSGAGQLKHPAALAPDSSGNVWIADTGNDRVEEFDGEGKLIRTLGEDAAHELREPEGIAVDSEGNVWVTSAATGKLEVFDSEGDYIKTVGSVGQGPGQLEEPEGLAIDSDGDVLVADWANNRIVEYDHAGAFIRQFGTEGSAPGQLANPFAVAVGPGGEVWVADVANDRVVEFDSSGHYTGQFGTVGAGNGQLDLRSPVGLAVNGEGKVWLTDSGNDRIEGWIPSLEPANLTAPAIAGGGLDGETLTASPGSWRGVGELSYNYQWQSCNAFGEGCLDITGATGATYRPTASDLGSTLRASVTATDATGSTVASSASTPPIAGRPPTNLVAPTVREFFEVGQTVSASSGQWETSSPPSFSYAWQRCRIGSLGSPGTGSGELREAPGGIAITSSGDMWVSQPGRGLVVEFDSEHKFVRAVGGPGSAPGELGLPIGVAVDASGDVWVADFQNDRVVELAEDGTFIREFGSEGSGDGQLIEPRRLAVDSDGDVWVTDTGNSRVEEFTETGEYLSQLGSRGSEAGQFELPTGIAIDSTGDVWVVDSGHAKVEEFSRGGSFLGEFGTRGDGAGELGEPNAIAIDGSDHLWVTDTANQRVDEFDEHGGLIDEIGSGPPSPDRPEYPEPLALDAEGNIWIGDARAGGRVAEFSPEGHYLEEEPCASIEGASGNSYKLTSADAGFEPRVAVTAADVAGEATAVGLPNIWVRGEGEPETPEWPVNVFPPTISGVAQEGDTLTASPGTWTGSPPIEYVYTWQRCNIDGDDCSDIPGAEASTYTLTEEDRGQTIRVFVVGANEVSTSDSFSEATTVVLGTEPSSVTAPAITGSAKEGELISVAAGSWAGTAPLVYSYTWERCNGSGSECEPIHGAHGAEYRVGNSLIGSTLRAVVTASNELGAVTTSSEPTGAVTAGAPENITAPSIVGPPQEGKPLHVTLGSWAGTSPIAFGYQWQRCGVEEAGCVDVAGATNATYVPGNQDSGKRLRVVVNAGNASGSVSATSVGAVGVVASDCTDIWLHPGEGQWATAAEWSAGHKPSLEDKACIGAGAQAVVADAEKVGELNADGTVAITKGSLELADTTELASIATLEVVEGELKGAGGAEVTTGLIAGEGAVISGAGVLYLRPTAISTVSNPECNALSLSADRKLINEGSMTLDVGVITLSSGTWIENDGTLTVNSQSGCASAQVRGASSGDGLINTGTLQKTMGIGTTKIAVPVANQGTIDAQSGTLSFEGFSTSTVSSGAWMVAFGGEIQLHGSYTIAEGVDLSAVTVGGASITRVAVSAPEMLAEPAITGTAVAGRTLIATPGGWTTYAGGWGGTVSISYGYQWQRCHAGECEDIGSANGASYSLTSDDVGKRIRVIITATNVGGATAASSSLSNSVTLPAPPVNVTAPAVTGVVSTGLSVVADPGEWEGESPMSYDFQWQRCNASGTDCADIVGAEADEYESSNNDVESTLRVVITARNASGVIEATSAPSSQVGPEAPGELEPPTVAGTPDVGQILSGGGGDWAGTNLSLSYQWERCNAGGSECGAVAGAVQSDYELVEADAGSTIRLRVGAVSALGAITDVTAPTPTIGAASTLASGSAPEIRGPAESGQELTAEPGEWVGEGPIAYAYQWQSCNELGEECTAIEGATEATYTPDEATAGAALRVSVHATSEAEEGTRTSAATQPIAPSGLDAATEPPRVTGTPLLGNVLHSTGGGAEGEGLDISHRWLRCFAGVPCEAIVGETSDSLTLTEADDGARIVAVTASGNEVDSSDRLSRPTPVIQPKSIVNFSAPTVSGDAHPDGTLRVLPGIVSGEGAIARAYQWELCSEPEAECATVSEATHSSYVVQSGDAGSDLRTDVVTSSSLNSLNERSATVAVTLSDYGGAEAAIEAAEAVDPSLLAASTTATVSETSVSPGLSDGSEAIGATGSLTTSSISKSRSGAFAVNTPEGQLSIAPSEPSNSAIDTPTLVNGSTAVFAGTWPATDVFVRAGGQGASELLLLRSAEAPRTFTWEIGLGADQELRELEDGSVAVVDHTEAPAATGEEAESKRVEGLVEEPEFAEFAPEEVPEESEPAEEPRPENEPEGESAEESEEEEAISQEEVIADPPPAAPVVTTEEASGPAEMPHPENTEEQETRDVAALEGADAEVGTAAKVLMVMEPPVAKDAGGATIPSSLSVAGKTVTLTLEPTSEPTYPVIVDPDVAAPTDTASAAAPHVFQYGLADQRPENFEHSGPSPEAFSSLDPNLAATLHVGLARLFVNYNAANEPVELARLEQWLTAVEGQGLKPYVTLNYNNLCFPGQAGKGGCKINAAEYKKAIEPLITKFAPRVEVWGAWNEPDIGPKSIRKARRAPAENPLRKNAGVAAQFWEILQSILTNNVKCGGCTAVAGEFQQDDEKNHEQYIAAYKNAFLCKAGAARCPVRFWSGEPTVWGLHDYDDLVNDNRKDLTRFKSTIDISSLGHPYIWLGEAGVELTRGDGSHTRLANATPKINEGRQRHAAFDLLSLANTAHVERIYYYHYKAPAGAGFDSGLTDAGRNAREAYCVLAYAGHICPPSVATGPGGEAVGALSSADRPGCTIGEFSGKLVGKINPNGTPSAYEFQYGPTEAYGNATAPHEAGEARRTLTVQLPVHIPTEPRGSEEDCAPIHFRLVGVRGGHVVSYGKDAEITFYTVYF